MALTLANRLSLPAILGRAPHWLAQNAVARKALWYADFRRGQFARDGLARRFAEMGSFSSAGMRYEQTASGLLVPRGVDEPRLADYSTGARRLLMECGTTPLTTRNVFDAGNEGGAIQAIEASLSFGQPNPYFGDNTAVEITATASVSDHVASLAANFAAPRSVVNVATKFVVQKGTATHAIVKVEGATPDYVGAYSVNLTDGGVTEIVPASGGVSVEPLGGEVWGITVVDEVDGDSGNPTIRVGPHNGGASTHWTAAGTETIKLLHNQTEVGSWVGSPVRATGAPVARAPDLFTSDVSGFDLSGGFWVYFEGELPVQSSGLTHLLTLSDGSVNNAVALVLVGSSTLRLQCTVGGVFSPSVNKGSVMGGDLHKIAIRVDDTPQFIVDGASIDASSVDLSALVALIKLDIAANVSGAAKPNALPIAKAWFSSNPYSTAYMEALTA